MILAGCERLTAASIRHGSQAKWTAGYQTKYDLRAKKHAYGVVKHWRADKGYGFIRPDDGGLSCTAR
jgi:hypothetical protein